jgi:hypothetical protein
MSRRSRRRIRRRLVPLALALTLVVVAVPLTGSAAAKGPILSTPCVPPARNVPPPLVEQHAPCEGFATQAQSSDGAGGADAGIVAGAGALLALIAVGGVLVAIRRRAPQPPRPAIQH